MHPTVANTPHLLPSPADEQALKDLVTPFVEACPDMHDMAHREAQGILDRYGIQHLDPDLVWWHRFDNTSVTSSKTFLGWEHFPTPIESLTLPQLLVQRFHASDQDNADLLDSDGGFYSQGAQVPIYNESNEVQMYPSKVIKDLWRINFHDRYCEKMGSFWQLHAADYRTLAKLNFIAKAVEEHDGSRLSNENLKTVLKAVAGNISWPITLDMLKTEAPAVDGLRVAPLRIGTHQATDILRIIDKHGRQILYTPGELDAFHVFETAHDLHWWLLSQNNHPDNRARFMAHFPLSAQQQDGDNAGLNHTLDLLYVTWGKYDSSLFDQDSADLGSDAFTWLRDSVKERMSSDAELSLRSNGDLREKMWIGYLSAFTRIFGAMAVAGWPVALAAVGAGIANIGLNLDQAINGMNAQDRKAGVLGAIFSSIDTLFNLLALGGTVELAEVQGAREEFTPQANLAVEVQESTGATPKIALAAPGRSYVMQGEDLLAPFQTNEVLDGLEPVSTTGKYTHIYQPSTGGNYIRINENYYLVRYINEMKTWVIIDPANPYSFHRCLPVRLNAEGEWEPLTRPGLYGGGRVFGRLPWGRSASPLPDMDSAPTPYDVPPELREELMPVVKNKVLDRALNDHFVAINNPDSAMVQFKELRRTLYRDAQAFYDSPPLPVRPRIPQFGTIKQPKEIIKALLKESPALVIGEDHASVASKQFLIENMPALAKQEVKTLYLEHVFTDYHQADLDIFNRGGEMSEDLLSYLQQLDRIQRTDPSGRFNFLQVVKSAQANHIRVQAIDCTASYHSKGIDGAASDYRQKMMNYFAHTVIEADQALRGEHRWVALVGETHANTWEQAIGVSELEGGIGLRIEGAQPGKGLAIEPDPGRTGYQSDTLKKGFVKNDLRLQLEPPPELAREQALTLALKEPGMFTVERSGNQLQVVHRSRDGSLVRNPVQHDTKGYYLNYPKWPSLSNRRFVALSSLDQALNDLGLKRIRIP